MRLARIKVLAEFAERAKFGDRFLMLKAVYLAAGDDNIISDPKSEAEIH
jgi:hypothetical protein